MTDKLRNLGPKSQEMLAKAGITSEAMLRRHGSAASYLAVKRIWDGASLNLLWSLEGILTDQDWRHVAKDDRQTLALLCQLEDLEAESATETD